MISFLRTVLLWLSGFIILFVAVIGYGFYIIKTPFDRTGTAEIYIPKSSGLTEIVTQLKEQNAFPKQYGSDWVFILYSKIKHLSLKAGEYNFPQNVSLEMILDKMVKGDIILRKATFAEGITTPQILTRLENDPYLTGQITGAFAEGSLAPDTYIYSRGDSRQSIVRKMSDLQKKRLKTAWDTRQKDLPFSTPYEALIMASIVEKETGIASERSHVASVFINRLRAGMKLQSDPTVIYGITLGKESLGRPITKTDLTTPTPYNTYVIGGLPSTPIANAGEKAIQAVMNPMETSDFYFVADGTGGHVFAETLEDHNRNVKKWRELENQKKEIKTQN